MPASPEHPTRPILEITDPADRRVADFRRLNDSAYRRDVEAPGSFHHGLFIAEGWLAMERLAGSRHRVRSVLTRSDKVDRAATLLAEAGPAFRDAPLMVAEPAIVADIVGFDLHRGIVASAERGLAPLWTAVVARSRRLVLCEGVNDAANLGGIVRNAAALGADALALDPTSCDPLSRRCVRVSTGHVLRLPWCRMPLADGLTALVGSGWTVVALTPSGSVPLDDLRKTAVGPDARIAVMVGAEGPGLSGDAIAAATVAARITMAPGADSINVASAVAIACHDLFSADPVPSRPSGAQR